MTPAVVINPEHGKRCRVPAIRGIKGDAAALGGLVFRHFAAISFPNARHDSGASGVGVGRREIRPGVEQTWGSTP